ncbi:hypothetical protein VTJ83DRAFT_3966 [Remersonia thermophila]|uniref:Phosphoribulokinase/uridine kinase domain-containing protein n=1 Tax=Remersonia thermophila TaxID=72144 RepID=A0ABR4DFJ0_9PEZI
MDNTLNNLVDKIWTRFLAAPQDRRFLIAIAGIPGSGKTTLSQRLTAALNARHAASGPDAAANPARPLAIFVPMDGFHLTRAQLDRMPDPVLAHARRGAEWTFDGAGFSRLVERLAAPAQGAFPAVSAPSFDHALKDPKDDDIVVEEWHRIVVLEGNYLLLSTPPWSSCIPHYSHKVFVRCPPPTARVRLAARHLAAGIVDTPEEADRRAVENDLPNGDEVLRLLREQDVDDVVESVEDGGWRVL